MMSLLNSNSPSLFSPGQIAVIVIVSVLFLGLVGINIYLAYLIRKRGVHILETKVLQGKRDELLDRLDALREGLEVEPLEDENDEEIILENTNDKEIENDDDDNDAVDVVVVKGGTVIRYNRSFTARLIQAPVDTKARYSELKNFLLAYEGVRANMGWRRESFRIGKQNFAALMIKGKTLCLCLAVDPNKYSGTKYKVEDLSLRSKNATLPLLYRIKNDRRYKFAIQLISQYMTEQGVVKNEINPVNYAMPYAETKSLIRDGYIRVIERKENLDDLSPKKEEELQENTPVTEEKEEPQKEQKKKRVFNKKRGGKKDL